jgi:hypothetical protein
VTIKLDLPPDLIRKLQPVIRDLATTGLDVTLNDAGWDAVSSDSFMLWLPPGGGRGIQWDEGSDRPWDLVSAMDIIQDEVIEARLERGMGVWPVCTRHEHVPVPSISDDNRAVWMCPNTRTIVAAIGQLSKV